MFEGTITAASADPGAESALRPLDWPEIVARLAAARDLRAVFARPVVSGGSFVTRAAAGIARAAPHERSINFDALAAGKWPASTTAATAPAAGFGDRDN